MLSQLVNLLETKENGLSLSEISRVMKAQPSAVLCMIELLVQKRKLIEVGPDGKCCTPHASLNYPAGHAGCTTCGLESDCNLLKARGKRYLVADRISTKFDLDAEQR